MFLKLTHYAGSGKASEDYGDVILAAGCEREIDQGPASTLRRCCFAQDTGSDFIVYHFGKSVGTEQKLIACH
jgi:hypothetical protein